MADSDSTIILRVVVDLHYLRTVCSLAAGGSVAAFESRLEEALHQRLGASSFTISERRACDTDGTEASSALQAQLREAGYSMVLTSPRPRAAGTNLEPDVACCLLELAGALQSPAAPGTAQDDSVCVVLVGGDADWSRLMEGALRTARGLQRSLRFALVADCDSLAEQVNAWVCSTGDAVVRLDLQPLLGLLAPAGWQPRLSPANAPGASTSGGTLMRVDSEARRKELATALAETKRLMKLEASCECLVVFANGANGANGSILNTGCTGYTIHAMPAILGILVTLMAGEGGR
jgi:hypothetical protein